MVETLVKHVHLICLGQVGAMEPLGYFDPAGFCKVGDKVRGPVQKCSNGPAMVRQWSMFVS